MGLVVPADVVAVMAVACIRDVVAVVAMGLRLSTV
jgi:hypothetical protein